jgi:hypothetical protein
MKKISFVLIFVFVATLAWAGDVKETGNKPAATYTKEIMTNYSSTGNGTSGVTAPEDIGFLAGVTLWEIDIKGSPSNVNLKLKGSSDGAAWFVMDAYSTTSPEDRMAWIHNKDVNFVKGTLTTFTGGTSISMKTTHGGN